MVHVFVPELGRQKQEDFCEFQASLVYTRSSKIARATHRNTVSKQTNNKNTPKLHFGSLGSLLRTYSLSSSSPTPKDL